MRVWGDLPSPTAAMSKLKNSSPDKASGDGFSGSRRLPTVACISEEGIPWLATTLLYSVTMPSERSIPTHSVT
jgi:hypothetical protein